MSNELIITKKELEELYPGDIWWFIETAVEDNIINNGRWSIHHEMVFPWKGKHYKTHYSVAATEYQDESPWEYENEIKCVEVELKEVTVKKWVEV